MWTVIRLAALATCSYATAFAASPEPEPITPYSSEDARKLAEGAPPTRIEAAPISPLVGSHPLTLQWLEESRPGMAEVENHDGVWTIRGFQRDRRGNFVRLVGVIERVEEKRFIVVGVLETRVHHMANGIVCRREGPFTFRVTGKRKYWRLKEMLNPCEGQNTVDYVDVYFEPASGSKRKG